MTQSVLANFRVDIFTAGSRSFKASELHTATRFSLLVTLSLLMAVKSAKRALQSPTHPNAPKKGRVDSQSADTSGPASQPAEIITIDDDDAPSPPSLSSSIATTPSTATTGTSSLVIETDRIEYLDSDGPAPPPAFPAKIIVNGQRVGELTAQKIVLKSTEFISENGNKIPIARPGKRVLRVGGVNVGYDGFTLTLPRTPCSVVDISYTSQGCRATIDGVVTYQKVLSVNEAEQKFHDVVSRFNAEDAALSLKKDKEKKAAAEDEDGDEDYRNEWHKLYIRTREQRSFSTAANHEQSGVDGPTICSKSRRR